MRVKTVRALGSLFVFALLSPAGFLFSIEPHQPVALTSPTANFADTETATTLFNRMQKLAGKVNKEAGPIEVQNYELSWQDEGSSLDRIKSQINKMGSDLLQLSEMRKKLEPWQQRLLKRTTPDVHEMVYQTDAAIKMLNAQEDTMALQGTPYPQSIGILSHKANQLADSVGTFTQYVHAAQKLAALQQHVGMKASS